MSVPGLDSAQNDNATTLHSYQQKAQIYVETTPHAIEGTHKEWTDKSLALIPKNGKILEIGSGFGRDAEYIRSQGFAIECSDAVPNFIKILKEKGFTARTLNLLKDPINGTYDMVLANAVLLHFTPKETAHILQKVRAALKDGGIFALRVKKGDGAAWSNEKIGEPRYFYYWQPEELKATLTECNFDWLDVIEGTTTLGSITDWLCVITRKVT
jgi:SAM-dependent methyltransferase